jgi:DNA helicase-2/ATP-dependent DNA helicase PcrA
MSEDKAIDIRNESSERILNHDYRNGPLLLLAGPGTGKTFSLLETIKFQSHKEFTIGDFYEVTLTNTAAEDFIRDAKKEISDDYNSSSTLHYRAKGILHRYASKVGLNPGFTIIDNYCKDIFRFDLSSITGIKRTDLKKLVDCYQESEAKLHDGDEPFISLYNGLQYYYSALDWFRVVSLACRILGSEDQVRDEESNKSGFILIDEYQDLNPADQLFIQLLLNGRNQLLAVGDDDQSIYSGRYADPAGIVTFTSRYKNASVMHLPVTSRLPTNVISASHQLISHNQKRFAKNQLIPIEEMDHRANSGFVISVNTKSGKAERVFICQALDTLFNQKVPPENILILCNYKALGIELFSFINSSECKYPIINELEKEFDLNPERYLIEQINKFIITPQDNLSMRILLDVLLDDYKEELSKIVIYSFTKQMPIWEALQTEELLQDIIPVQSIINNIIHAYVNSTAYESNYDKLRKFIQEVQSLQYLLAIIEKQDKTKENIEKIHEKAIRIMTIHSSKGLDADFVFIPFMEESIGLPGHDIEEQRRLLYVALTRAKVGVIMTWAWSRQSDKRFKSTGDGGSVTNRKPSPFITECGININLVRPKSAITSSQKAIEIINYYSSKLLPKE